MVKGSLLLIVYLKVVVSGSLLLVFLMIVYFRLVSVFCGVVILIIGGLGVLFFRVTVLESMGVLYFILLNGMV